MEEIGSDAITITLCLIEVTCESNRLTFVRSRGRSNSLNQIYTKAFRKEFN